MTFAVPACQYELLWQIYLKHMPACIFLALFKMIDERTSVPNPLKPSNKFISLPQNTNIAIIVFFKGRVPFIVLNSLFSEMDTYSSTTTTSFFFFIFSKWASYKKIVLCLSIDITLLDVTIFMHSIWELTFIADTTYLRNKVDVSIICSIKETLGCIKLMVLRLRKQWSWWCFPPLFPHPH